MWKRCSCEREFNWYLFFYFFISLSQIKEVAPRTTQNQHRLWDHDIKVARDYNTTSQTDEDLTASQQIVKENLTNIKKKDEQMNRLYRQSYNRNWSATNPQYGVYEHDATISDLEGISLCMEYPIRSIPMRSQFDTKPIKIPNDRNRSSTSTSPPSPSTLSYKMSQPRSPSLLYNLQSMGKFRLERIPEVPPPSLSTASPSVSSSNENQNTNDFVDSSNNSENTQNDPVISNEVK